MATKKKNTTSAEKSTKSKKVIMQNFIVYVCDVVEKRSTVQIFMYSEANARAGRQPYSVMTEYDGRADISSLVVYNNGMGPVLSMANLREATDDERSIFFDAASHSNLQFVPTTGKWQTIGEKKPIIEEVPIQILEKDEVHRFSKGDIIGIICRSENEEGVSKIIGEVDHCINLDTVVLSSWAYVGQIKYIREKSQVTIEDTYQIPMGTYYEFMISRFDTFDSKNDSKERRNFAARLLKRIVEDTSKKLTKIVVKQKDSEIIEGLKEKDYFLCADFIYNDITPVVLGNITKFIEFAVMDRKLESYFSKENIVDYNEFFELHKQFEEQKLIERAKETIDVPKSDSYEKQKYGPVLVKTTEQDIEPDYPNMNWIARIHAFEPCVYETPMESSYTIDPESEDEYIIINEINSDKVSIKLSDDPCADLNSRKINRSGRTAILGPIRDASKSFDILKEKLCILGWHFENNITNTRDYESEEYTEAFDILQSDIVNIQKEIYEKRNGFRLIDYVTEWAR